MIRTEAEKKKLLTDLTAFYEWLMRYKEIVIAKEAGRPIDEEELQTLSLKLQRKYGGLKEVIEKYGGPGIELLAGGDYKCEVFREMFNYPMFGPEGFDAVMNTAIVTVNGAIGKLESQRLSEGMETGTPLMRPKAFIAHGVQSKVLEKLKNFLSALGIDPLVVEDQASEDRSANENVEHYLGQADCAIVLATKGDIDGRSGKFLPRGNVLVEAGRFQERFSGRTIYLLEDGASLPSNISEKVWEGFTQDNMERAFIKIAKELRAFGIIKTGKPDK